ncbi:MAG: sugar ABC transporter substrate-binding protein [Oscillospiraceae bacterium]|nr:sugar ABC transporter substrate-binding protein [Oscillospiraceae bacterium]
MKKAILTLLAVVLVVSMFVGCGSSANPESAAPASDGGSTTEPEAKVIKVGYYGISPNSGFFKELYENIKAACDERGWEIEEVFTDYDPQKMRAAYDQFKLKECDVIIDANAVQDVIRPFAEEALADGIPYLSLWVALDEPMYTFGTSNAGMGKAVGTFIGERVNEEWGGEVDGIILVGTFDSAPAITERLTTAVPAFEEVTGHKVDNVIQIAAVSGDTAKTYQLVSTALTTNPGHLVIFCQTDDIANATFSAVEDAGRSEDVMGTGSDCIEIALEYFKRQVDSNNMTCPWRGSIYLNTKRYAPMILDLCQSIIDGTATEYAVEPEVEIGSIYNLYEVFPNLK